MTEKQYGGNTGRGTGENSTKARVVNGHLDNPKQKMQKDIKEKEDYSNPDKEKILQAGRIASQVREWIRPQIKRGVPLIELAEKIEEKITDLGGRPAFPVNLSINGIAAHYTPSHDDKTLANGLLKIDFGVHIDGWTADNAFSIDLEDSGQNKKMIKAGEDALENAIKMIKKETTTGEIGSQIQKTIESHGFEPVINLSGHGMENYQLHSGISIPNVSESRGAKITEGLYALEPFVTNGSGRVRDGKSSGIYELISEKNIRSQIAREVLNFIIEEYETLPFCSRWLVKELGTKALIGLKQLEENGNLHQFSQLVECSTSDGTKVSQAEHTILIDSDGKVIVTTL